MLSLMTTIPVVMINTAMITVVWMRFRQQRAGIYFIATAVIQILLAIISIQRRTATSPGVLIGAATSTWMLLALLALSLLLFFAALYVPEWWQRTRVPGWIALPYLLVMAFIGLSNLLNTGWLIAGVERSDRFLDIVSGPLSFPMGLLSAIGWLPHLVLLIRTFMYQPQERQSILVLIGLLIFCTITGFARQSNPFLTEFASILNQIVLIGALAYLLLRRKIFETRQVVMDQAVANMAEGIAVLAPDTTVQFTNQAIEQHLGLRQGNSLAAIGAHGFDAAAVQAIMSTERMETILETDQHAVATTVSPITDSNGQPQGYLLLTRDVTQTRAYEHALQQRQAELIKTVEELQKSQATQQSLIEAVRELSLPIIPVAQGVIIMPLIGTLDRQRTQDFEERLLDGIQQHGAHTAVLDLTGVPPIDQQAASVLVRAVGGAKLLGAQTVVVGIRPEIAQSIVALGIRQSGFATALTLQEALETLLHRSPNPSMSRLHAL